MNKTLLRPQARFRIPEICAATAIGIALLALIGWLSGVQLLAREWAYFPMAPSTVAAFLLLAAGTNTINAVVLIGYALSAAWLNANVVKYAGGNL